MKVVFKILLLSIIICVLNVSCASVTTSNQNKSFVILKSNDTVFGKRIQFSRGFNEIGTLKVVHANGEKQTFPYTEIYQVYHYRKKRDFYKEEMVALTPNNPVSLTLMDVVIKNGTIKLYQHDPTNWGNMPFVVSGFYHGYVRTKAESESFIDQLQKCSAFYEKYSDKVYFKNSNLQELVTFYNENCDGK